VQAGRGDGFSSRSTTHGFADAQTRAAGIGYLTQELRSFRKLSVEENILAIL